MSFHGDFIHSRHEIKIHPIYFLNMCYRSYSESLTCAYVYFDLVMFNQKVITGSSGENDRHLFGDMQDISNHLVCFNPTPASSCSSASIFECNVHISIFNA